jgi:hypothetical protein
MGVGFLKVARMLLIREKLRMSTCQLLFSRLLCLSRHKQLSIQLLFMFLFCQPCARGYSKNENSAYRTRRRKDGTLVAKLLL